MPVSKTIQRISMVVGAAIGLCFIGFLGWLGWIAYDLAIPNVDVDRRIDAPDGSRSAILEWVQRGLITAPVYQAVLITPPRGQSGEETEVFRLEYEAGTRIDDVVWVDHQTVEIRIHGAIDHVVNFRPQLDDIKITYRIPSGG